MIRLDPRTKVSCALLQQHERCFSAWINESLVSPKNVLLKSGALSGETPLFFFSLQEAKKIMRRGSHGDLEDPPKNAGVFFPFLFPSRDLRKKARLGNFADTADRVDQTVQTKICCGETGLRPRTHM